MQPELSKSAFWAATVIGTVCVLVLATLTVQSLFRLFGAQPEKEKATAAVENALPGQDVKSVSDAGEYPSANPAAAPAAPVYNEFCTDSELIRQQERERQERIDNLRLTGKNSDSNAVPPAKSFKQQEKYEAPLL